MFDLLITSYKYMQIEKHQVTLIMHNVLSLILRFHIYCRTSYLLNNCLLMPHFSSTFVQLSCAGSNCLLMPHFSSTWAQLSWCGQ